MNASRMNAVPLFDATLQTRALAPQIEPVLAQILASGRFVLGPCVEEFEQRFAEYCQAKYCVACNSGTSALHLALRACGISTGDEVITVPMTFIATAWSISYVGAVPVFVDIDPSSFTLDVERLAEAISPRTKAILPVHLYGRPAALGPILELASRHGLRVIEDACQAHGARYRDERIGGLGDVGCFSFYPTKNLGACGEGGALVTNDASLADQARALRDHAQSSRYRHDCEGYNYRMDAMQGGVLCVKLPYLDGWNAARSRHADHYRRRLGQVSDLEMQSSDREHDSVWHLFVVATDERDALARQLARLGIGTGLHYPLPLHLQPAYRHLRLGRGAFPVAERLAERCLSLPMFPELTSEQVDQVCDAVELEMRRLPSATPGSVVHHTP